MSVRRVSHALAKTIIGVNGWVFPVFLAGRPATAEIMLHMSFSVTRDATFRSPFFTRILGTSSVDIVRVLDVEVILQLFCPVQIELLLRLIRDEDR